jgi:TonB family protein
MKKNYLLVIALVLPFIAVAQDTIWISKKGTIIPSGDSAERYNIIYKNNADTQEVKLVRYLKDGTILEELNYLPYSAKTLHGVFRRYRDGRLADERIYQNNKLHGTHKTFWENGRLRRNDLYEKGAFINGQCYGFNGGDTTWFAYQISAGFPGGNDSLRQYLTQHLKYPPDARLDEIEGTVNVQFTITKDGSLTDIKLSNKVNPLLDNEAIRLVSGMPKWQPAIIDGRVANMSFILPVVFRLSY